ncbi:MAG: hypothetical protein ABIO63_00690, partial [Casimicrobiaceae bacterium]
MPDSPFRARAVHVLLAFAMLAGVVASADAARVGVLSNRYFTQTATDFNARVTGHTFTPVDTSSVTPTLKSLTDAFDVILLFEDETYANAPSVGNVVAAYANTGRAVVIGAFYDQDRSDSNPNNSPHGWGALEGIDPNTTDGFGTPGAARTLNVSSMQGHTLTRGITALTSASFAGGNQAKVGTTVLANWAQPNARGQSDPAIAFRITGAACVIHLAIAPNYAVVGTAGVDYSGDFHRAWRNAFDFGAANCVGASADAASPDATAIPTLSSWGLALTILLLGAGATLSLRRRA